MNKWIIGLVTGVAFLLSLSLSAQPVVTITPQSQDVAVNQEFSVDVIVSNFSNVASVQFPIVWNPDVLEYVSVSNFNDTGLPGLSVNSFGYNAQLNPGKLSLSWLEPNFNGVNLADGTRIFTITFRGKQNGNSQIAITNDPPGIEVTNPDEQNIGLTPQNATVKVGDGGPVLTTLALKMSDHNNVEVGQDVCVKVRVENFTDLIALQFSANFDPALLQFKEARAFNGQLPGLTAAALTSPSAGVLQFQWSDATARTLPKDAVLLELCFTALNSGAARVTFENNPLPIEATQKVGNNAEQKLPFTTDRSNINIIGGTGGGFQLRFTDVTVQPGEEFCMPVRINGFENIVGLQFSVQFDPNLLEFRQARNFNSAVTGLEAANINNSAPGVIRFQWNDQTFTGVTLSNGAAIVELCFRARAAGTTTVQFTSTPLAVEVTQKTGTVEQQTLDFTVQNGTVTIQGDATGPGFDGFGLYFEDRTAPKGSQVCLPIKVQDFEKILGMQFSLKYNQAALQFVEARSFGLDGLGASSLNNPSPGVLTLTWDDPAVTGKTLADGTVILELCFTILGNNGTTTQVTFENTPTQIEFIQAQGDNEVSIDYNTRNGTVTIGTGDGSFEGFGLLFGDAQVPSGQDVCIPVTVQDFKDILGMQFSISYNASHLEFVQARNFGLNGLEAGNIGNVSPGALTVVWDDPAVAGQTLADGAVLFELCFKAKAPNGTTTQVQLANSPTPIEFVQVVDDNEEVIEQYGSRPGTIKIEVVGAPTLFNSPSVVTNVNCFGATTGAINITVQGGTAPYTYKWSYQNKTTEDLANIPAGSYTVTVTDSKNLTGTGTFEVTQPTAALAANVTVKDADCAGQGEAPNGSITLAPSGGTPQYTIDWGGNLMDGKTEQTGLAAGKYSFTITDSRGCTFNSGDVEVKQKSNAQVTLTPKFIDSGNDGGITLAVTGGTGPFTYAWTGPNNFTSTQQSPSGLRRTGEYCVTLTDASGCQAQSCTTVYAVLKFAQVDIVSACAGQTNGSINVQMSGGKSPYKYKWSVANATTATLNNLAAGSYSLTVTDDKGDKINGTFEVNQLAAIRVTANITQVTGTAGNNNGAIKLDVTGGQPGYTITWQGGATGAQRNNLKTGNYCATITDQNGCSLERCFEVAFQAVPLSFTTQLEPASCNGVSDGRLTLAIVGGSKPYEVTFGDGTKLTSDNNGQVSRADLPAGKVTFTVKDAGGTSLPGEATIVQPDPIKIAEARVVHDSEAPGCTGSIRLSLSGGTPGYNVLWNSPNTGMQIINLCAGDFIPTVADSRGCTQTFPAIKVNTFMAGGQVTNASCPTEPNGSIELNIAGGAKPYSYRWTDATGDSIAATPNLEDVVPGKYTVTITETSGNTLVREFTVGSTSNLSVAVEVLSNYNGYGVSCPDSEDGSLQASGQNGTGVYAYEWTRGEEMVGTQATLNNVPAGLYEVTVIDENGCEMTIEVELTAPPELVIVPSVTDVQCYGSVDGEIDVRVAGGAGNTGYTYRWTTGANGPRINRLAAGAYSLTVTDGLECQAVQTFEVREPEPLAVAVETKPAEEGCNGSARAIVTGGTAPFFYKWNSTQTDSVITNLCPGTYAVEVEDSRGCKPEQAGTASGLVADRRFPCMEAIAVITPNNDGDNELFLINCIEEFPDNNLEVFNRWGQMVFEAENYDNSWGGTDTDGEVLPEGPYYYVLHYQDGNGAAQQLKGSFTLLR